MTTYTAPTRDMRFVLDALVKMDDLAKLPGYEEVSPDLVDAVLEEAGKLASEVWAPTNTTSDRQGCVLKDGEVKTPDGVKDAYAKYVEGGWNGLTFPEEFGGQNLPWSLSLAVEEMWQSGNLALSLCGMLTKAAVEAIEHHGTQELKDTWLPKLVSGEWTGAMCLTEPQAGTDLAQIRTTATKEGDHYRMRGQKIFITFGEHDMTDNLIHMVLARVDGLPEGNDGLGLFLVPKFLLNDDGAPGERNDMHAVSLEHKLGIHGSPTCVYSYGDTDGAICYLVGEEGKGLRNMFTMMNNARIGVGLQGVALCERAYQHALQYAQERVQSPKLGDSSGQRVAIIEHADVRRMLLTMKAYTEAARAITYYAGGMIDREKRETDADRKAAAKRRVDLMTPLVKAWATDLAVEVASIGIQIHGGMGFIEETGAAQFYRDARILPIYEGTNGIQSNDLVFRKVLRDNGAEAKAFIAEMREGIAELSGRPNDALDAIERNMAEALDGLEKTTDWLLAQGKSNMDDLAAGAVPYLRQFATVAGGYMMARSALAAHDALEDGSRGGEFCSAKLLTARFFAEALLPMAQGLVTPITGGHGAVTTVTRDQLASAV